MDNSRILVCVMLTVTFMSPSILASTYGEYRLLDVDRMDFVYGRIQPDTRNPVAPEYTGQWRDQAQLLWDIRLLEYLFWRNNIHTETVEPSGTVKTVGWEWKAGVELGPYIDVQYHHHSQHIMDETAYESKLFRENSNQFPVYNSVEMVVHIIKPKD